jgi:hypothetical protein
MISPPFAPSGPLTGHLATAYDHEPAPQMHRAPAAFNAGVFHRGALVIATIAAMSVSPGAIEQSTRPADVRIDEATRLQGEALVSLADARARGERVTSDFDLEWTNDFFKARPGTFVPFTLTFAASALSEGAALLYVRVETATPAASRPRRGPPAYAYETIFPIGIGSTSGDRAVVRRGFAVEPGSYRVTVVMRETIPPGPRGGGTTGSGRRRTAILERTLEVPNFWTGELALSSIMLAERLEPLAEPVPPAELDEDPYVVGSHRIHPVSSPRYNRLGELIVVFLVYNPTVGPDRHFDVQVDYHLFRQDRKGEAPQAGRRGDGPGPRPGEFYVTRTNPQRFNPSMMGPRFDPAGGAPVLAGQAIPLKDFEAGDYRLNIVVTDLLSRRTLSRDVSFAVVGSQP